MYRIKTVSGEESVFKTLEEFNAAVRSGAISPDSEIFHSRAERWLEVKSHPHYRAALSWKPETANGSAQQASRAPTRATGAKPSNSPDLAGAAPASASRVARPETQPRLGAGGAGGAALPDAKQLLSALSGKQPTMPSGRQMAMPSGQQPAMPSGQLTPGAHQPSTSNGQHSMAAPAHPSVGAPPKPQPPAPGLRTVVAPPKAQPSKSVAAPAQSPAVAAPKPPRKPKSAEILFIDLDDEPPAAAAPPVLSPSAEHPALSPVAPTRRAATAVPVEGAKESHRAESRVSSEQPRVSAEQAGSNRRESSPQAEAQPSGEQPKVRPVGFSRPVAPAAMHRTSEPPAQKGAGPVAPLPETELDFLVMGPSAESPARKSNGERLIEQEPKARSDAPAMGNLGAASPLTPPLTRGSLLHGSGSRPALGSPHLAGAGTGAQWPIESKAESPRSAAPAAALVPPLGSNRAATRLATVPTLETAPITLPTMEPMIPERPKSKSSSVLTMVGLAAVLASVAFVWKPWQSGVRGQSSTQSTQGATLATNQSPTVQISKPPVPVTSEPETTKPPATTAPAATTTPVPTPAPVTTTPATTPPAPATSSHPEKVAKPDSVQQPDDQIEAAVAPGFQSESIDISSAKVDLSSSTSASSSAIAPSELSRRYAAATAQTKQEFLAKVVSSGFIRIFSTQRLATTDGISGAQAAWSGGAEAVRQYRARIAKLESIYGDSVVSSQRSQRWPPEEMRAWASHASLAESSDAVQVADLMFRQVGDMLALLQAQQGQYEVKGGGFAFKDPAVAQRYNSTRIWVAQRAESWASTPESARPLTISQILKALGDGLPAVAQ